MAHLRTRKPIRSSKEIEEMRHILPRWKVKGKLKVILFFLVTFSTFFITYQYLYYSSLNEYQAEETKALRQLNLQRRLENQNKDDLEIKRKPRPVDPEPVKTTIAKIENKAKHISPVADSKVKGKPNFSPVLGVPSQYWNLYNKVHGGNKFFQCFGTGKKLIWSKVNDDYCDCPIDGSDEPSTSACLNGRFFCTKTNIKFPEEIPSSRVNDGFCDCCDGSDEYETLISFKVICKNLC